MRTFLFTCCFTLLSLVLPAQKNSFFWMLSDSIGLEFDSTGLKRQFKTNAKEIIPWESGVTKFFQVINSAYWNDKQGLLLYNDGHSFYDSSNKRMDDFPHLGKYNFGTLLLPLDESGDSLMFFRVGAHGGFAYSILYKDSTTNKYAIPFDKRDHLISNDTFCNKFAAIRHANNRDWWVIQHKFGNNEFWVLKIENGNLKGINKIPIGTHYTFYEDLPEFHIPVIQGHIAVNPEGNLIAATSLKGNLEVFKFNKCTGTLSDHLLLNPPKTKLDYSGGYESSTFIGCSFSPNSRFLYVSCLIYVIQFDLHAQNPATAYDTVYHAYKSGLYNDPILRRNQTNYGQHAFTQHKIGLDGKIYLMKTMELPPQINKVFSPFDSTLAVIHEPNKKGAACRFELNAIPLQFGARTKAGMYAPTYSPDEPLKAGISASDTVVCVGDSVQFFNNSCGQLSHEWRLDGWQSDTSQNPIRKYIQPGIYKTKLLLTTYRPAGITHLEITVRVKDCLKADFTTKILDSDTCGQVWVQFNPEVKQGTPNLMEWDFGDGQTSNEISPVHLYTQIGTFKPTLKVRNTDDELTIQALEEITVEPCPTEPQEMKLYPNPNNGTFTLEYVTEETLNFEVFNVLGQLIARIPIQPKLKKHELTLDVAEGVYFYRVNLPSGKYVSGKLLVME